MTGNTSQFDEHLVDTSVLEGRIAGSRTVPEFTMQAVINETGVPGDTLRSWERRYGFPQPARDESNYRIYTERDIVAAAWLREQTQRGQGISEAVKRLRTILDATTRTAHASPATSLSPVNTLSDALLAGDVGAAQAAWDRVALSVSPAGLVEHVLLPAHSRLASADLPRSTRLLAASFLQRKATVLFDSAGPDRGAQDIAILILGTGATSIPAYCLATVLARDGYRVHGAINDLRDATTLAALRDIGPNPLVVVVSDRPDADLIAAAATIVGTDGLYLWWPDASPDRDGHRWLPASVTEALDRLAVRG